VSAPGADAIASTARRIEQLLHQRLEPAHLEVRDESAAHIGHANAGKGHFRVKVVSTCFAGLAPLQRHRLVNEALSALLANEVHALAMETLTPDEFFK
jgi:BolA family transcriptional regulator, general stress-responsive regulator